MTLQVVGNIIMKDVVCEKCSELILIRVKSDTLRCNGCGARYNLIQAITQDQHIDFEFEFYNFECMHNNYLNGDCFNECPAMKMFCKEHSSPECQGFAQIGIDNAKKRLDEAEARLHNINESRKIWLIQEVSGLDDDDASQTGSHREDSAMEDMGGAEGE